MLMKVWHCYFEHCNNDSNFQCQITASRRKREMGGGKSRGKKKCFGSNRVCHQPGCARQMDHEYCLDALCLSGAVVSKDKQWDAGLSDWGKSGRAPLSDSDPGWCCRRCCPRSEPSTALTRLCRLGKERDAQSALLIPAALPRDCCFSWDCNL